MRKRTLSIVLAAAMCASLTACGGGGSTAETTAADSSNTETKAADASEKSDKPLRVCVVYTGNLGDKSYNDSCNMGAQKAVEDFGIELKSLEGTTAEEWKANLLQACDDGYDLITVLLPTSQITSLRMLPVIRIPSSQLSIQP